MSKKLMYCAIALILLLFARSCDIMNAITCASQGGEWVIPPRADGSEGQGYCDFETEDSIQVEGSSSGENVVDNPTDKLNDEPQISEPQTSQHAPAASIDPQSCSAGLVTYTIVGEPIINDTDHEFRCEYTITFSNNTVEEVWFFLHQREKGHNTEVKETWNRYYKLAPGEILEMTYGTLRYKESNFTYIDVVMDVAVIKATDDCKTLFRNDIAPREQIKSPLTVPCSDP